MTLPLTIDVEFIEPASYVLHNSNTSMCICVILLANGDQRVGKIS